MLTPLFVGVVKAHVFFALAFGAGVASKQEFNLHERVKINHENLVSMLKEEQAQIDLKPKLSLCEKIKENDEKAMFLLLHI